MCSSPSRRLPPRDVSSQSLPDHHPPRVRLSPRGPDTQRQSRRKDVTDTRLALGKSRRKAATIISKRTIRIRPHPATSHRLLCQQKSQKVPTAPASLPLVPPDTYRLTYKTRLWRPLSQVAPDPQLKNPPPPQRHPLLTALGSPLPVTISPCPGLRIHLERLDRNPAVE